MVLACCDRTAYVSHTTIIARNMNVESLPRIALQCRHRIAAPEITTSKPRTGVDSSTTYSGLTQKHLYAQNSVLL